MFENTSTVSDWNKELAIVLIPNDIILTLYLILGIIGNTSVIVVYRFRMKRQSDDRFFIPVLAASDLSGSVVCASFGLALNMMQAEFTNTALCKSWWFFAAFTTYNTILLLTIISIHRYLKVCRPFGNQMSLLWKRVAIIIGLCLSVSLAGPTTVLYGSVDFPNSEKNIVGRRCSKIKDINKTGSLIYSGIVGLVIVASFTTLIVLYSRIGHTVHKHFKFVAKAKLDKQPESKDESTLTTDTHSSSTEEMFSRGSDTCCEIRCCIYLHKDSEENAHLPKFELESANTGECVESRQRYSEYDENEMESTNATSHSKSKNREKANRRVNHKFTIIFMIITIVFLICYIPKVVLLFIEGLDPNFWEKFTDQQRAAVLFVYRMYILGNVCNPFIYAFMDYKFRKEFNTLFKCS